MNVTGQQVRHRMFGEGIVTGQTDTVVTVKFPEPYGVKNFIYPKVFQSFLTLCHDDVAQHLNAELVELRAQAEEERRKREVEAQERAEEERKAALAAKRAAAKKSSAKRAAAKKASAKKTTTKKPTAKKQTTKA